MKKMINYEIRKLVNNDENVVNGIIELEKKIRNYKYCLKKLIKEQSSNDSKSEEYEGMLRRKYSLLYDYYIKVTDMYLISNKMELCKDELKWEAM